MLLMLLSTSWPLCSCLAIVFYLDEPLIVANTMKPFEDRIEMLFRRMNVEDAPIRVSGMPIEIKRYIEDRELLKEFIGMDTVTNNGRIVGTQKDEVLSMSGGQGRVFRFVIRLPERNAILARINPEIRNTSVFVKLRPAWEDLRNYLTAKGRKRFEVYVCTMPERDYAPEVWRLLDPEAKLISLHHLSECVVCVKSDSKRPLQHVFNDRECHSKMAMVIDDKLQVWDKKDQPRVHVVPAYTPYYASQAEGFRKVHAERWEFAHEDFLRHSKHLLKKIVRRRFSPTQQRGLQPGSSGEFSLHPELHTLRREKSGLLQEVGRLKQEHRQTIEHMSTLNQRLELAEDRQKQMVSFLAKLLQNPTFLRQLKLHRQRKETDSTRVKRKFLKHVPHGHIDSGESSSHQTGGSGLELPAYSPMPPGEHDDIADLRDFLLEDMDLNLGMLPDNLGLNGVETLEDIGALVQGFDTQDEHELGNGAELLEMPPASGHHGQDPTIGRSKGKNVPCPGSDGTSSDADCLGSLSDNMGVISGTMVETAGKLMDADDEQIWGVDASAALQSSCSGTSQQAYSSIDSDPYLMEIANKPEKFWELDFQALDEGDLQLDKCVN